MAIETETTRIMDGLSYHVDEYRRMHTKWMDADLHDDQMGARAYRRRMDVAKRDLDYFIAQWQALERLQATNIYAGSDIIDD